MDKEAIDKYFELIRMEYSDKVIQELGTLIGIQGNINEAQEEVVVEAYNRFKKKISNNENIDYLMQEAVKKENFSRFLKEFSDNKDLIRKTITEKLSVQDALTILVNEGKRSWIR